MLCSGLTWKPSREPPSRSAKPWPEVTNHPRMPMSRKTMPRTRPTVRLTEVVERVPVPADMAMGQTSGDERTRARGCGATMVYPRRVDSHPAAGEVTRSLRRSERRPDHPRIHCTKNMVTRLAQPVVQLLAYGPARGFRLQTVAMAL